MTEKLNDAAGAADALQRIAAGEDVAVICRSRWDAQAQASKFMRVHAQGKGFRLRDGTIVECPESSGTLEFCWISSESGRGAGDFAKRFVHIG